MANTTADRVQHFAAAALIGDGVAALVAPSKADRAWKSGPRFWHDCMEWFAERPTLTRALAAAQVAGGIFWLIQQQRRTLD